MTARQVEYRDGPGPWLTPEGSHMEPMAPGRTIPVVTVRTVEWYLNAIAKMELLLANVPQDSHAHFHMVCGIKWCKIEIERLQKKAATSLLT